MEPLTLYVRTGCPFCRKVLEHASANAISLEIKNIGEREQLRQELTAIGGKSQVPCLVIGTQALYESDDIIAWLTEYAGR